MSSPQSARMERLLSASRLLSGIDPALVSDLAQRATTKQLSRGDRLWRAGDRAEQFTLIQAGLIKILRRAPDGSEVIVALFGPHESVGDVAVIGRRAYPADAQVASEKASVVRIDAQPILAVMDTHPDVARRMSSTLVEHTQLLHTKIGVLSAGAVPKRLATLLLSLAERFGDEHDDGSLSIPVAVSRSELACLVSARVETTIRTIRQWERSGIVSTQDDGFVLHQPEALQRITRAEEATDA